jgi:hypothetical protein
VGEKPKRVRVRGQFGNVSASQVARHVGLPARQVWEGLKAMEDSLGRPLDDLDVGRFIYTVWEARIHEEDNGGGRRTS